MSLIWWEKTVEYFFVRNCVSMSMIMAPLDGEAEKAGDSIFSRDNRWILIEFKRDEESLKSEEKKFGDFRKAQEELSGLDGNHFLVYGVIHKTDSSEENFGLQAKTYFAKDPVYDVESMLSAGKSFDEFFEYVKIFTSFKKTKKGFSGGLGIEMYGLVAGINENNQIVECLSLGEFGQQLGLDLTPESAPSQPPPSPSPSP